MRQPNNKKKEIEIINKIDNDDTTIIKKKCNKCKFEKKMTDFHKNKRLIGGRSFTCAKCTSIRKKFLKNKKLKELGLKRYRDRTGDIPVVKNFWDLVKNKENGWTLGVPATSGSGKSTILTYLAKQLKPHYDLICLVSQNASAKIYKNDVWDIKIKRKYMDKFINQLRNFQENTNDFLKIVIVFDDVTNQKFKYSKSLDDLIMNGRNHEFVTILSSQYSKYIGKGQRAQFHFIMLLREINSKAMETTVETFMDGFVPSPPDLNKKNNLKWLKNFLLSHTKNYNALILNYKATTDNEKLYTYKAKLPL